MNIAEPPTRRTPWALWIVIAVHVTVASMLAWVLNIWADESCTLYSTQGSLSFVVEKALFFEWQPPAFHILLSLWRLINDSVFFTRCFCIVCNAVTIWMVFAIARQLAVKNPMLPALLFAFHPFAMFLATEIRLYGFATMISAFLLWGMIRAYWDPSRPRAMWLHTMIAILALYTNILLALPLVAQSASVFIFRRTLFPRLIMQFTLVAVVFAPILLFQLSIAREADLATYQNTLASLFSYILGSLEYVVLPLPRDESTVMLRAGMLLALTAVCVGIGYQNRSQISERHRFAVVYLALSALGLAAFIFLTNLPRGERYTYVLMVPGLITWSLLLDLIPKPSVRWSACVISLCFCLVSAFVIYRPLCKTGDWIRVAAHLQATESSQQPILAFPAEVDTLLKYYYRGANKIVPVPGPQRFDRFAASDFRIADRQTLQNVLLPELKTASGFTLVTSDPAIYREESDDPLNFALLQDFLAQEFDEVARDHFFESTVRRFQRHSLKD